MAPSRITRIPLPGGSGVTPTGAMQFKGDWPGLFIRGDDAIGLMSAIHDLSEKLGDNRDPSVAMALARLSDYAEIIARDVRVQSMETRRD